MKWFSLRSTSCSFASATFTSLCCSDTKSSCIGDYSKVCKNPSNYNESAPLEIINGKLSEDEKIFSNNVEIGRVLINEEYPFALIKFLDKNFNKNEIFKTENGSFKIVIPEWLKI